MSQLRDIYCIRDSWGVRVNILGAGGQGTDWMLNIWLHIVLWQILIFCLTAFLTTNCQNWVNKIQKIYFVSYSINSHLNEPISA